MKFGILVNEGPYTHQASDSAYLFAKAAIDQGHEIYRIFFYHDGVNNGTRLATPPQDDRHIPNRWSELAKEHNLDLVLCVAAAQRRGMVDPDEMKRNKKDADNIADNFRISGLGQLIEAGIQADRLITFGDQMEEEAQSGVIKKFLYINRRAPHGTIYAHEALEVVLIGAAFEQDVSMAFLDDGVFQLKKDQNTDQISTKNFSKTFSALEMYDVEKLYVEKESLDERGISADDLAVDVKIISSDEMKQLITDSEVILNF